MGHTHEDIDAFFGVYSKHLDLNDVYTMDGKCTLYISVVIRLQGLAVNLTKGCLGSSPK